MTVDTPQLSSHMFGVQHPMMVHYVGQLIHRMTAQAGRLADLSADQRTGLLPADHDVEIAGTVDVGFHLSPPSRLGMAFEAGGDIAV
jgi:hypothetical protein